MTTVRDTDADGQTGNQSPASDRQVVLESDDVRLIRVLDEDGGVLHVEAYGDDAEHRLRYERAILERLAGVAGVPQLVPGAARSGVLVQRDIDGVPLSDLLAGRETPGVRPRWAVTDVIWLGLRLARVLAEVHHRGVTHSTVNPATVMVSGTTGAPTLIGFHLATTVAEERPHFTHQSTLTGALAYLAPELTGRTGWPVDQRADLYGLGATLYHLVVGQPPFGDNDRDRLRLVHDHLTLVPVAPAELRPDVPTVFSDIVMRLLEKEPDRRYQSAEGLAHDLARLGAELPHQPSPLGERDFPLRLTAPSQLIGRSAEAEVLKAAFQEALAGHSRGVLVSGPSGVGKTTLVEQLRTVAGEGGGWLVTGAFDQHRQDIEADGLYQALRALGRMLLAEPESALAVTRERIRARLGANLTRTVAALPELALLLGVEPTPADAELSVGDQIEAQPRLVRAAFDLLCAVASPTRPVVVALDNLQWAPATPLDLVDAMYTNPSVTGLLVVGVYRDTEIDPTHPLATKLARWERLGVTPPVLRLGNLSPTELAALLAEMLRLPAERAIELAEAVGARTGGNPFDAVELVNALRQNGVLAPGASGWTWDPVAIRQFVGSNDVLDLLAGRLEQLPPASRDLLEVIAHLGGEVDFNLLRAATGLNSDERDRSLAPALEDGLLVLRRVGPGSVRFRHGRVRQLVAGHPRPENRREQQLALARRLATHPGYEEFAAEQYLPAVERITDLDERQRVVTLFTTAAGQTGLVNPARAETLLTAAVALLEDVLRGRAADDEAARAADRAADRAALAAAQTGRHAALYRLGRLDEADEVYAQVERYAASPLELAAAACTQLSSLNIRNRHPEVAELGMRVLNRLGLTVPAEADLPAEAVRGMKAFSRWIQEDDLAGDLRRPDTTDPWVVAVAEVVNRTLPSAFTKGPALTVWLVTEAGRLWAEHGPCAALIGPLGHAPFVTIPEHGDIAAGYRVAQRILAVGTARGYEPQTSQVRFMTAVTTQPWFEPVEESVTAARLAREGLIRGGDPHSAGFTFNPSITGLLTCGSTLSQYEDEVAAGLEFVTRTGNDYMGVSFLSYRQLGRALRGHTTVPGGFTEDGFDEKAHLAQLTACGDLVGVAYHHLLRGLSALVFGDHDELHGHVEAVLPSLRRLGAMSHLALLAHLLHCLSLAARARTAPPHRRAALLAEADSSRDWLARRAEDAPGNYRHLLRWVDAERLWAGGELPEAAIALDLALHDAQAHDRTWHQALIIERAALFHIGHGLRHYGRTLLIEARDRYAAWGAHGKVTHLHAQHPYLTAVAPARPTDPDRTAGAATRPGTGIASGSLDLRAVLEASRALSSETNLDRLQTRVVELLGALTGATRIQVLLWDSDNQRWFLPTTDGRGGHPTLDQAAERGLLPLTAVRYVERTREPLLVADATRDDRFLRDPYLATLVTCSLLVVPILTRGTPRAILLLENHLASGAFSDERLDGALLIAGQLSVSLDNALLYASLENKVAERTEELAAANHRLQALSVTDSLTGLPNRRRLQEVLDHRWRSASRSGAPLAVAMIDVDHFKAYNDRYGHPAGDECLRQVAQVLRRSLRDTDLAARYGGEEFALVLPNADLDGARRVAERVRRAIAALEPAGSPAEGAGGDGGDTAVPGLRAPITVSIGIAAVHPAAGGQPEELIQAADAQLYQAKHGGRNQVSGVPAPPGAVD